MNKRKYKKRLKKEASLHEVNQILEAARNAFHRETALAVKQADQKLAARIKQHFEIADDFTERHCYHEKEQLKRTIQELEAVIYNLKVRDDNLEIPIIALIVLNIAIIVTFILKWSFGS